MAFWQAGRRFASLIIVGLRDSGGRRLADELVVRDASLEMLRTLQSAGVSVKVQRFPQEASRMLFEDANEKKG